MSSVMLRIELPDDWAAFRLPSALDERLRELLDRQDQYGFLDEAQRREAEALCNLVDMLALLKLRAENANEKAAE
jgi:hypothetical protein